MSQPEDGPVDAGRLAQTAVRGALVVAVANVTAHVVGLAGALYLMERVGPGEFGTVEYAVAMVAICGALGDWGLTRGAIHRRERVDETFSTCLVLRLAMLGGVLCLLGAASVTLRGPLAGKTRGDVLAVLAASLLLKGVCDVLAARLGRAMRFGRLAAVDTVSAFAAAGVAVAMAAHGFGIWALVGNRVSYAAVRAAGLWVASVERTRFGFHRADAVWLLRFGLPLWLGGLATTWVLKYDDLVVGTLRDATTLGHYGRAYALALLPLALVTGVLTRVSLPLYARLQAERGRLSEAFRIASGTTLRLVAPLAMGMALVVPDFLAVMGWAQWTPMVAMFRWLLLYTVLRPLMDDAGGLLTAVGQPKVAGHTLLCEAGALLALCPVLTWRFGPEGAAASVGLVVLGGLSVWYIRYLPRFVDVAYRRIVLWPLLSVGVGAAAAIGIDAWAELPVGLMGGVARLAVLSAGYGVALLAFDGRQTLADLRTLRRHAFGERRADG